MQVTAHVPLFSPLKCFHFLKHVYVLVSAHFVLWHRLTSADGSKTEEGSKDMGRIVYDDEMLDKLLDRHQAGITTEDKDLLSEYFSAFKVASFSLKEEDEVPPDEVEVLKEESEPVDSNYWEKLLRHHYEQQLVEENAQLMGMGKGKRLRKAVS